MADPLSLLRQYHLKKKEIIECDQQIIFGNLSWPKNANTNYQTFKSSKKGIPKEYYTLETFLFLLKHKQLPHPVYIQRATAENIPAVRRPDRKAVLAYLNGQTGTSAAIDKSVPLEIPTQLKRPAEGGLENGSIKRPHLEETHDLKDKDQLIATRLDASKEVSLVAENVRSLSEAMSDEKIAAIKAKRLAKKYSTESFNISNIPLPISEEP